MTQDFNFEDFEDFEDFEVEVWITTCPISFASPEGVRGLEVSTTVTYNGQKVHIIWYVRSSVIIRHQTPKSVI
jgi:hypothetical protein